MNYIKIFQNAQALSVSVGNTYSEDQLMHVNIGVMRAWHAHSYYYSQ